MADTVLRDVLAAVLARHLEQIDAMNLPRGIGPAVAVGAGVFSPFAGGWTSEAVGLATVFGTYGLYAWVVHVSNLRAARTLHEHLRALGYCVRFGGAFGAQVVVTRRDELDAEQLRRLDVPAVLQ